MAQALARSLPTRRRLLVGLALLGLVWACVAATHRWSAASVPTDRPLAVSAAVSAAPGSAAAAPAARFLQLDEFTVYVPAGVREPGRVLFLLHGMGGSGEDLVQEFRPQAERYGLVLAAPTFVYGDWRSPDRLTAEAKQHLPRMVRLLERLPSETGLALQDRVVLYGFSRGGQTANRFALMYPEAVAGVAIASAGVYTVPADRTAQGNALGFPYGVSDLSEVAGRAFDRERFAQIAFWIGVGERDADPSELPREWDPYLGSTRVERALRFASWVQSAGASVEVQVLPGLGHAESSEERAQAIAFLAGLP